MMRVWLILMLILLPCLATAQPVIVRTGEHADFTRVVLTIPEDMEWQLGRDAQGYVLRLPVREGYDLSRFFDLIPRTRITGAAQRDGTGDLALAVTCPCNASAFLYRPDILVIDINDGLPSRASPFELALEPASAEPVKAVADEPVTTGYTISGNSLLPVVISEKNLTELDFGTETRPEQRVGGSARMYLEAQNVSRPDGQPDLAGLETAVLHSLGQGLAQGMLSGQLQAERITESENVPTDAPTPQALPGIALHTGVDQAAVSGMPEPDITQTGGLCLPAAYFDVPAWGDDRPFHDQINPARAALLGEFDRVDDAAVTALARLLVYFGFGREARQALALDEGQSQERLLLDAIARIVDDDPLDTTRFAGQVSCPSGVAIWALLASPANPLDSTVNRASVLRSFRGLPSGLQATLGPRLSERFVAIGDFDAASQVLGPARDAAVTTVEMVLADAALVHALGAPDAALAAIAEIARQDTRVTPDAMIRFFRRGMENGFAFSESDFENANALRFENASHPIAVDLLVAQVEGYVHIDRFEDAAALLAAERDMLESTTLAALEEAIALQATARADDATFLRLIWSDPFDIRTDTAQNLVAERLLQLGFPQRAREILQTGVAGDATSDRTYLLAEAALALGEAGVAEDLIGSNASDRAGLLQRQAQSLRDDLGEFTVSGNAPINPAVMTRWTALQNEGSGQDAGDSNSVTETARPLAEGRALLDQSAQARAMLEGLLQQYQAPVGFE